MSQSNSRRLVLELDELDYAKIQHCISTMQRERRSPEGTILPDPIGGEGESNLAGAILAEICRGWEEYRGIYTDEIGEDSFEHTG